MELCFIEDFTRSPETGGPTHVSSWKGCRSGFAKCECLLTVSHDSSFVSFVALLFLSCPSLLSHSMCKSNLTYVSITRIILDRETWCARSLNNFTPSFFFFVVHPVSRNTFACQAIIMHYRFIQIFLQLKKPWGQEDPNRCFKQCLQHWQITLPIFFFIPISL